MPRKKRQEFSFPDKSQDTVFDEAVGDLNQDSFKESSSSSGPSENQKIDNLKRESRKKKEAQDAVKCPGLSATQLLGDR